MSYTIDYRPGIGHIVTDEETGDRRCFRSRQRAALFIKDRGGEVPPVTRAEPDGWVSAYDTNGELY